MGAALDAREITSAENLTADVEGDIEDVNGGLKITAIRIVYRVTIPAGKRDKLDRALANYADKCPAYQSVKGCIAVSWDCEASEQ